MLGHTITFELLQIDSVLETNPCGKIATTIDDVNTVNTWHDVPPVRQPRRVLIIINLEAAVHFFRPTPHSSCQVVHHACKPVAY